MYDEFFEWEEWDGDVECFMLLNVSLRQPIGKFEIGEHFDLISIDYTKGDVLFYRNNEIVTSFKIKLEFKEIV